MGASPYLLDPEDIVDARATRQRVDHATDALPGLQIMGSTVIRVLGVRGEVGAHDSEAPHDAIRSDDIVLVPARRPIMGIPDDELPIVFHSASLR